MFTSVVYIFRTVCLKLMSFFWPQRTLDYWNRKNVINVTPKQNCNEAAWMSNKVSRFEFYKNLYEQFNTHDYVGFYFQRYSEIKPKLLICSLELVEMVLRKNFAKFSSRLEFTSKEDPFVRSIFNLDGSEQWKAFRQKFLPAFGNGKLGLISEKIMSLGVDLKQATIQMMDSGRTVDVNVLARRYVIQVIASCVFGTDENIFANPDSQFVRMANILRKQSSSDLSQIANLWTERRKQRKAYLYFKELIRATAEARQKNAITKPDFLQFFLDLMESEKSKNDCKERSVEWTFEETVTHSLLFTLGGYTSTASVISFALYEIAKNPKIQEKLRAEIAEQLNQSNKQIDYNTLQRMPYLDKVVLETMRKYPPFAVDIRVCTEECPLTGLNGPRITVAEGITVVIPISGIHHNPKYYPNPLHFEPDRFEKDAVSSRSSFCYLPFGDGPRKCIGKSFGLLCIKVALFNLISQFQVSVSVKDELPFEFLPNKFTTTVACVKLQFIARTSM